MSKKSAWKWLSLIFMTVGVLLLTIACNSGTQGEAPVTTAPDKTLPREYCIILPKSATGQITDAANSFAEAVTEYLGTAPRVIKENKLSDEERADTDVYRILVGMTGFLQTVQVYETLPYGSQTITAVDGALVVGGWYDDATVAALNSCRKMLSVWAADGELKVPVDYSKTVDLNETLSALPRYPDALPKELVDCGDGCMMMIFKTTEASYNDYISGLQGQNFRFYSENKIANIRFSTHEDGKYVVNTVCYTGTGEVRLMIEPLSKTALAPLPEKEGQPDTPVTLTQIGLNLSGGEDDMAGMSYLFRLEDGSFLVIDGGYYRDTDANRLYQCMREQSGESKPIVIAAWIMTHGHGDHLGCFMRFTELYSDKVTVERFIYNDPCAKQRNLTGDGPYYQLNRQAMQKYPGAVIHKAHPGQVYAIRNVIVEIYYTLELYEPNSLTYYNDCSLVFSVRAGGQKIMFLGDISENVSPLIASLYQDALACDLLQVAHHGFAGGTAVLYQYLSPTYLLWPSADFVYTTRISADRFKTLSDSAKNENCFVAGNRIISLLIDAEKGIVKTG